MNVHLFKPEHLFKLSLQESQRDLLSHLTPEYALSLAKVGPALTAEQDGQFLACVGVGYQTPEHGVAWAFISADAGPHLLRLDRAVRRFFSTIRCRRLEATVKKGFTPGCRWLELLGFEHEGPLRGYGPDGSDYVRYARVR